MSLSCHKMWSLLTLLFCSLATARVMVDPHVYIAVLRGSASFVVPPTLGFLHGATWTLNGNVLQEGQNVAMLNIFVSMSTIIGLPYLNISNIPAEYNNSVVGCEAYLNTRRLVTADEAILRLQGPLAAIVSLTLEVLNSTIVLAWRPPFTQDIRGVNPDITYCVTIVGQNISGDETLVHKCDITETRFYYLLPRRLSWCYNIYANVTPVNPAGNGESFVKPWNITDQSPVLVPPPTYDLGMTDIELNMSAPVCTVELVFVDLDTGETITLEDTDLTLEENSITFSTNLLTANRHYNVTIRASNAAGSSISYFNISVLHVDEVSAQQPFSGSEALNTDEGDEGWKLPLLVVGVLLIIGILIGAVMVFIVCLWLHKRKASSKKLAGELFLGQTIAPSGTQDVADNSGTVSDIPGQLEAMSWKQDDIDRQVTDHNEETHGAIIQGSYLRLGSIPRVGSSTTCLLQTTVPSENTVTKESHPTSRLHRTVNCDDSPAAGPTEGQSSSVISFSAQGTDGDVEVHKQAAIQQPIGSSESSGCPARFDTNQKMICGGDCDGSSTALRQQPPPESVQFSIG